MSFLFFSMLMGIVAFAVPVARAETQAVVIVPVADVWSNPAADSSTLTDDKRETQVLLGERVIIHESSGSWAHIEAIEQPTFRQHNRWEGYPGWVHRDILGPDKAGGTSVPVPSFLNSDVILKFAQSVIGAPYLWGGLSAKGLDCSGLVHLAYRHDAIKIPRDAHEQWMKAKSITLAEMKPGDLIFSAKADNPMKITHVALYAGGGQIIEAPQTGMRVQKISFKKKYGLDLTDAESGEIVGDRVIYFGSFSQKAMTPALIKTIEISPVSFRLKNPFVTATGRKNTTENVQVMIHLSDGTRGVAEASSSIAMPGESQQNMLQALKDMIPELRGRSIDPYKELVELCWRLQRYHPTAAAAMECAILDAYTRTRRQSLAKFLGNKLPQVETDFTLSVGTPDVLFKAARAASRKGFRRLKVKLGGESVEKDLNRMKAVHRGAPKAVLVADGNQGLSVSHALQWAHQLEKAGIKIVFLEQPFRKHDIRAMKVFRSRCRVPLFADESVLTAHDAIKLFEASAADGVNIKVAKSGLLGALDIIRTAQRFGKRLAIGCMEESKLGLAASVHLACGTGVFEWVDLDSVFLLESISLRGGFLMKGPKLSVKGMGPGIGI